MSKDDTTLPADKGSAAACSPRAIELGCGRPGGSNPAIDALAVDHSYTKVMLKYQAKLKAFLKEPGDPWNTKWDCE
jgi:hypothetical protein